MSTTEEHASCNQGGGVPAPSATATHGRQGRSQFESLGAAKTSLEGTSVCKTRGSSGCAWWWPSVLPALCWPRRRARSCPGVGVSRTEICPRMRQVPVVAAPTLQKTWHRFQPASGRSDRRPDRRESPIFASQTDPIRRDRHRDRADTQPRHPRSTGPGADRLRMGHATDWFGSATTPASPPILARRGAQVPGTPRLD